MKKTILFCLTVLALIFSGNAVKAQALPPNLFSLNGWMTDTVGARTLTDTVLCPGLKVGFNLPCYVAGELQQRWGIVKDSKAKLVRYGGISADQNYPTKYQYLKFVDSVRARGMEPILQISVNYGDNSDDYDTIDAKDIINFINNTMNRNVTYWSIGNEPDHALPGGYGYDTKEEAFLIATYIKNFSKAMRRAVPSVPIKIMGPELAEWNADPFYTKKKLVDSLVGEPTHGLRCDIMGKDPATNQWWIDYFSFHQYSWDGDDASPLRSVAIGKLRSTNNFAESLSYLKTKVDAANTYYTRGASAAKIAVTEANTAYQDTTTDAWSDVKCNGFYSGQHWLEMASIAAEYGVEFVNYWSAAENSMGYMKSDGTKKSSYCHFQKAAESFTGLTDYYTGTDNQTNIKAFGAKNNTSPSQIAVIVMNQDTVTAAARPYTIRLDNTLPGTTTAIKMNMGVSANAYVDTIAASSTTLLLFDQQGNISQKTWYKQSLNNSPTCFHQNTCNTTMTYASQIALNAYYPGIYQDITIGDASGINSITINGATPDFNNSIYRAVDFITLQKNVSVLSGQTLTLLPSACN